MSIDRNEPTIATAPKLSLALKSILPIMAVSVIEIRGSAIPAIKAGIAKELILLKLISIFKFLDKKAKVNTQIIGKTYFYKKA